MSTVTTPVVKRDLRSRAERLSAAKADTRPRHTISFYRYVRIVDPVAFRHRLLTAWGELECRGRIYVAHEGINAQMDVLVERWDEFDTWTQAQPELASVPYKRAVEEGLAPSFSELKIKVRDKIVADGLHDASFDVTKTGAYLTAAEMNEYVTNPDAVVVDMRNAYESEIGHFHGAITPDVETFREELTVAPELLAPYKDKKIALYCTGGIRCEKASAWLRHHGFRDVRHLQGGIIDYARQVKEQGLPNMFRGKNFVFDERLGERVSDEIISTCHVCQRAPSDTHHHCKNTVCHELFLACDTCLKKYAGYCSRRCELVDRIPAQYKVLLARVISTWRRRQKFKKVRLRTAR